MSLIVAFFETSGRHLESQDDILLVEQFHNQFWCKPRSGCVKSPDYVKRVSNVLMLIDKWFPIANEIKFGMSAAALIGNKPFWNTLLGNRISVLAPFLELLYQRPVFGIIPNPRDIGDLFYYTCFLEMQHKLSDFEVISTRSTRPIAEVIDLLGEHVGFASWLYIADLKYPHNLDSWNSWYLSQIIQRNGYSLLLFVGDDNIKCPDGSKVPAFALAGNLSKHEVVLCVRGTHTESDIWDIDLDYKDTGYQYVEGVIGKVHSGFLKGATGILDTFGIREMLSVFKSAKFDIKIIGHSMGAAVAVLIAADLRRSLFADEEKPNKLRCYAYACPPCVTENLAQKIADEDFVFCMINGDDLVPRISMNNLRDFKKRYTI
jgi:hypothetical protein